MISITETDEANQAGLATTQGAITKLADVAPSVRRKLLDWDLEFR